MVLVDVQMLQDIPSPEHRSAFIGMGWGYKRIYSKEGTPTTPQ